MQGDNKQETPQEIGALKSTSDTCVFLGSGRSINNVTDEQWAALRRFDLWTVNNWVYHPTLVPHFYHVEAKHYNYEILQRRFAQKKKLYRHVNFIFPRGKTILVNGKRRLLHAVVFPGAKKFDYAMTGRDMKRTHAVFSAKYEMDPDILTKSYDMSVTAIFELLYKLGYKRIVTFGVDLRDSFYFWTGRPECGEVHHQTNKAHEGKDPNEPHATARILNFIIDFNFRWMRPNGREICVGHEDTALYPYLRLRRPENL